MVNPVPNLPINANSSTPFISSTSLTMISTSSSFSSSANFIGSKVFINGPSSSPKSNCIRFRPLRISAACASTAERTRPQIASSTSLYEVLGLQVGATCPEIKAAYRRLARLVHPDVAATGQRGGHQSDNTSSSAGEFMKVHEAYATLSDPEKRADYDRILYSRRLAVGSPLAMTACTATMMASAAAPGFAGYTRRTWETDQCW